MEFHLTPQSSPSVKPNLSIDLSVPESDIFFSGYNYYETVLRNVVQGKSTVLISTLHIGINITDELDAFIRKLAHNSLELHLFVGFNEYDLERNREVLRRLRTYKKTYRNITIRQLSKLHIKACVISTNATPIAWAGSLNLVSFTLYDVMFRLTLSQSSQLHAYLLNLWSRARPVQ